MLASTTLHDLVSRQREILDGNISIPRDVLPAAPPLLRVIHE